MADESGNIKPVETADIPEDVGSDWKSVLKALYGLGPVKGTVTYMQEGPKGIAKLEDQGPGESKTMLEEHKWLGPIMQGIGTVGAGALALASKRASQQRLMGVLEGSEKSAGLGGVQNQLRKEMNRKAPDPAKIKELRSEMLGRQNYADQLAERPVSKVTNAAAASIPWSMSTLPWEAAYSYSAPNDKNKQTGFDAMSGIGPGLTNAGIQLFSGYGGAKVGGAIPLPMGDYDNLRANTAALSGGKYTPELEAGKPKNVLHAIMKTWRRR